jgi:hypothetical protein
MSKIYAFTRHPERVVTRKRCLGVPGEFLTPFVLDTL